MADVYEKSSLSDFEGFDELEAALAPKMSLSTTVSPPGRIVTIKPILFKPGKIYKPIKFIATPSTPVTGQAVVTGGEALAPAIPTTVDTETQEVVPQPIQPVTTQILMPGGGGGEESGIDSIKKYWPWAVFGLAALWLLTRDKSKKESV